MSEDPSSVHHPFTLFFQNLCNQQPLSLSDQRNEPPPPPPPSHTELPQPLLPWVGISDTEIDEKNQGHLLLKFSKVCGFLQQLASREAMDCDLSARLEEERAEFSRKDSLVNDAISSQDPQKIRDVLGGLLAEMAKYNEIMQELEMDVESSKDLLNQVEKIQGDLQKVASFQQKVLHRKVGNREKYGSLKRLSSERASAVSCILSALLNSLPISYCDEARKSLEKIQREIECDPFQPERQQCLPDPGVRVFSDGSLKDPGQSRYENEIHEPVNPVQEMHSYEARTLEARSQEAKRKRMNPDFLERLFLAQKTLYSLFFAPGMALEEDRSIPVVELGLIQEVEKNLSKWFPKEYSLTRKRKVCVCSLFPHLKGYDETQVRFRTKVKGVLVDVIPLLVPVGTDTMSKDSSFRQKLKILADSLKLSDEDLDQIFLHWETALKQFPTREVSFKKKSPQREWVKRSNEILERSIPLNPTWVTNEHEQQQQQQPMPVPLPTQPAVPTQQHP